MVHFFKRTSKYFLVVLLVVFYAPLAQALDLNAHPALWLVEKGEAKVYLFGSFHLLPKDVVWYGGVVEEAFESADEMVMETVMTPEAQSKIQKIMLQNAALPEGKNLKDLLSEDHFQKLLIYTKNTLGYDEATTSHIQPWFLAINLSVISIMKSGMDPAAGVDTILAVLAGLKQKPLSGLETPEEQMTALVHHPLDVQSAMLADTLDQLDDFARYIRAYLDAWMSGDATIIADTMVKDMADNKALYQALLVDRNKKWMPQLEAFIAKPQTTFVVVGAAHLVGEDGLVRMLRDKGYTVKKVQ